MCARVSSLLLRLLPLVGSLALASCGTSRYFAPRENANGSGPSGLPAAVYPLAGPDGRPIGEVRLWSNGGFRSDADGAGETTRVRIGFELENGADVPLVLAADAVRLTGLVREGDEAAAPDAPALAPVQVEGQAATGVDGVARVQLEFDVGGELMPRQIAAFAVTWSVTVGDLSYRQVTPFLPFFPEPMYWDGGPWYGFYPGWRRYCW